VPLATVTLPVMSTQDQITSERRRAADLLDALEPGQLSTPSLCGGWSVQDVFGHQLMTLITPLPKFAWAMLKARGDFDRANDQLSRAVGRRPASEIAAELRARASSSFHAPGFPLESALLDALIHGQDIRRPLGLTRDFDPDAQRKSLDVLTLKKAQGAFVPKGRSAGLTWHAEDIDWTFGSGPSVIGPAEAIMLAMTGRDVALADLHGEGLAVLKSR
jgi:uncharacterized protein (TIGR03083 family)